MAAPYMDRQEPALDNSVWGAIMRGVRGRKQMRANAFKHMQSSVVSHYDDHMCAGPRINGVIGGNTLYGGATPQDIEEAWEDSGIHGGMLGANGAGQYHGGMLFPGPWRKSNENGSGLLGANGAGQYHGGMLGANGAGQYHGGGFLKSYAQGLPSLFTRGLVGGALGANGAGQYHGGMLGENLYKNKYRGGGLRRLGEAFTLGDKATEALLNISHGSGMLGANGGGQYHGGDLYGGALTDEQKHSIIQMHLQRYNANKAWEAQQAEASAGAAAGQDPGAGSGPVQGIPGYGVSAPEPRATPQDDANAIAAIKRILAGGGNQTAMAQKIEEAIMHAPLTITPNGAKTIADLLDKTNKQVFRNCIAMLEVIENGRGTDANTITAQVQSVYQHIHQGMDPFTALKQSMEADNSMLAQDGSFASGASGPGPFLNAGFQAGSPATTNQYVGSTPSGSVATTGSYNGSTPGGPPVFQEFAGLPASFNPFGLPFTPNNPGGPAKTGTITGLPSPIGTTTPNNGITTPARGQIGQAGQSNVNVGGLPGIQEGDEGETGTSTNLGTNTNINPGGPSNSDLNAGLQAASAAHAAQIPQRIAELNEDIRAATNKYHRYADMYVKNAARMNTTQDEDTRLALAEQGDNALARMEEIKHTIAAYQQQIDALQGAPAPGGVASGTNANTNVDAGTNAGSNTGTDTNAGASGDSNGLGPGTTGTQGGPSVQEQLAQAQQKATSLYRQSLSLQNELMARTHDYQQACAEYYQHESGKVTLSEEKVAELQGRIINGGAEVDRVNAEFERVRNEYDMAAHAVNAIEHADPPDVNGTIGNNGNVDASGASGSTSSSSGDGNGALDVSRFATNKSGFDVNKTLDDINQGLQPPDANAGTTGTPDPDAPGTQPLPPPQPGPTLPPNPSTPEEWEAVAAVSPQNRELVDDIHRCVQAKDAAEAEYNSIMEDFDNEQSAPAETQHKLSDLRGIIRRAQGQAQQLQMQLQHPPAAANPPPPPDVPDTEMPPGAPPVPPEPQPEPQPPEPQPEPPVVPPTVPPTLPPSPGPGDSGQGDDAGTDAGNTSTDNPPLPGFNLDTTLDELNDHLKAGDTILPGAEHPALGLPLKPVGHEGEPPGDGTSRPGLDALKEAAEHEGVKLTDAAHAHAAQLAEEAIRKATEEAAKRASEEAPPVPPPDDGDGAPPPLPDADGTGTIPPDGAPPGAEGEEAPKPKRQPKKRRTAEQIMADEARDKLAASEAARAARNALPPPTEGQLKASEDADADAGAGTGAPEGTAPPPAKTTRSRSTSVGVGPASADKGKGKTRGGKKGKASEH